MTGLAIRQAGPGDDAAILSMVLPVFRAGETYTVPRDIAPGDALAYWRAPGKTVFLAEDAAGAAVGTYYIRPNAEGGGDHVCNCGYVTSEAARGLGVARAMLKHSIATARDRGFRAMQYNFVVATNERAVATWTRAGFRTVGRLPGAFRHPTEGLVDALVMWRDIGVGG
ncbi:GNAT family N-acetyltransferase [Roseibacterium sp. SDUM158017]|uniref:GNAT family N-acetyltransferase n=1 Tax=Roseicyclus salinarum TaxID=3036773 RepID=UPI0024151E6E|nr:GNAT family N-acetyltransferase [Roseibacterium sp. SDUM158017]MDG4646899.1 GNAT family N-acetyltransferase [Roseibacterium sp. SDUM158017]